jgi:hypothetical protein
MRLPGALKYLTFLMVVLGVLTLLLLLLDIQYVAADHIVLVMLVLFGSLFLWETKLHTRLYAVVWNVVTIGYVIYLFSNFQARNLIVSAAYLSIFLQIFKCYNRKTNKDYVQMYLISFFQFVSCTGITSSPLFFINLTIYMFVALWALIAFHMKRRLEKYSVAQFSDKGGSRHLVVGGIMDPEDIEEVNLYRKQTLEGVITPGFLGGTLAISVLILISGLMLFYILPRPTEAGPPSFLASIGQQLGRDRLTGLSDEVDLSAGGKIIDDDTMVMKIKPVVPIDAPATVLWRAGALDHFDGTNWKNSMPGGRPLERTADGLFVTERGYQVSEIRSIDDLRDLPELTEFQAFIEFPSIEKMVSAYGTPVAFAGVEGRIRKEGSDTYLFAQRGTAAGRYSYSVFSKTERPPIDKLQDRRPRRVEPWIVRYYLNTRQVPPIVDEILRNIGVYQHDNVYDRIKAIERHLEDTYTYTKDVRRTPGVQSPVEDFLVHTMSGHCELFATTMAVLCRRAGIPARLVYGYKTSEWNEYGQFYQVRRRDAHAWVEVFFPSVSGWVYFDPSPAVAAQYPSRGFLSGLVRHMGLFVEALKSKWYDSVVFYDLSKQKYLALTLVQKTVAAATRLQTWAIQLKHGLLKIWSFFAKTRVIAVIALLSTTSVLVAAVLLIKKKVNTHRRFKRSYQKGIPRSQHHKVRFYEKMLRILMGIEIIKAESITPMEFARDLEDRDRIFSGVSYVTELYYSVRYGGTRPGHNELRKVSAILSNLRKTTFLKR